ncbi:tryptophan--tRNA ligase [Candidatus Berkelbacteria bacterium]|nr:tryptophan--tRNA ligase [Candidatus Berkelbacteria bacterium]
MRVLSGIQPSGVVHLGNYLGAIRQHIELQNQADQAFYSIVDLHAITTPQEPKDLHQRTLSIAALYLALGLNPEKASLFVQSHRPEHTELTWILTTIANLGELERMTQFKEKGRSDERNQVPMGLLSYPLLMAADILIYKADRVPVGDDQVQHLELTRDLAKRFNSRFGETFPIPEPVLPKNGARIMGLDDPTKKMSKSATSENNYIALTDDPDTVTKKIKKAVTDSGSEIELSDDKPALKNLLTIFSGVTNNSMGEIVTEHQGQGYADFKANLAEAINEFLAPVQAKYNQLISDENHLLSILKQGSEQVAPIAQATLKEVKEKIGFIV